MQCNSAFRNAVSRNSAANHVTLRTGVRRIAWKTLAVKQVSERRQVYRIRMTVVAVVVNWFYNVWLVVFDL